MSILHLYLIAIFMSSTIDGKLLYLYARCRANIQSKTTHKLDAHFSSTLDSDAVVFNRIHIIWRTLYDHLTLLLFVTGLRIGNLQRLTILHHPSVHLSSVGRQQNVINMTNHILQFYIVVGQWRRHRGTRHKHDALIAVILFLIDILQQVVQFILTVIGAEGLLQSLLSCRHRHIVWFESIGYRLQIGRNKTLVAAPLFYYHMYQFRQYTNQRLTRLYLHLTYEECQDKIAIARVLLIRNDGRIIITMFILPDGIDRFISLKHTGITRFDNRAQPLVLWCHIDGVEVIWIRESIFRVIVYLSVKGNLKIYHSFYSLFSVQLIFLLVIMFILSASQSDLLQHLSCLSDG